MKVSSCLFSLMFGKNTAVLKTLCRNASSASQPKPKPQKPPLPVLKYVDEHLESIPPEKRDKQTFHNAIALFERKKTHVRGHVEFINTALKHLEQYGLHRDLDTYKALLNVFPKGALIPRNTFQRIFLHYPMQQVCCVRVLDQMEWFGVQPDREVHDIVVNAFGEWNFATKKIKRMLYWMPKLKYSNKYLDRREIEGRKLSNADIALAALKMMARDPGTQFSYVKIRDVDAAKQEDWLVSAQSSLQKQVVERLKPKTTLYVDGPSLVYVMQHRVHYMLLTADADPEHYFDNYRPEEEEDDNFHSWSSEWEGGKQPRIERNIHEQKDEKIFGLAVFGKNDRKWAAAWINHLQEENPAMRNMRVLFRSKEEKKDITFTISTDLSDSETSEAQPQETR